MRKNPERLCPANIKAEDLEALLRLHARLEECVRRGDVVSTLIPSPPRLTPWWTSCVGDEALDGEVRVFFGNGNGTFAESPYLVNGVLHNAGVPIADDHVIVLFGSTGDLARRKLLPGLFHLHVDLQRLALQVVLPDRELEDVMARLEGHHHRHRL